MPTSTAILPSSLPLIRAALTLRRTSIARVARKHGASYHSCYAALAGRRPGRAPRVRRALREMFVLARRTLGPAHGALGVFKNTLHRFALSPPPAPAPRSSIRPAALNRKSKIPNRKSPTRRR